MAYRGIYVPSKVVKPCFNSETKTLSIHHFRLFEPKYGCMRTHASCENTYFWLIDAATDDYVGSTMNDMYSTHAGSFIPHLLDDENGVYVYDVARRLWEDGMIIPFFDGEYWYLVSGPDKNPEGGHAMEVIYTAATAELLSR